jgi:hypothetical protein
MENRIVAVELTLTECGHWSIAITKQFAEENGGGHYVFRQDAGREIHQALDVARVMVTLHPARNPGAKTEGEA